LTSGRTWDRSINQQNEYSYSKKKKCSISLVEQLFQDSMDDSLDPGGGILTAEQEAALLTKFKHEGATTTVHALLSSMVNYAEPVKFQRFDTAEGE